MVVARKLFSETVAIGSSAVSMASLLRAAGYGFEPGTDNAIGTTPSMDSFIFTGATVIPAANLYVGHDEFVSDVASSGPPRTYQGVPALAGEPFSIQEFTRGLIDANEVWFYSAGGAQDLQLICKAI